MARHGQGGESGVEILYEDDDLLVVNKQAGMIVHPAPGHERCALTELLVAHAPKMAGVGSRERPGVVHRLDIGTSGVMVFAKSERGYRGLRRDFESHEHVCKTYLAVLHGAMKERRGELRTQLGRKPWDPKRMAVVETGGQLAVTRWEVLKRSGPLALVEFTIKTGRMHQIRVHAAHLGHPIAGDDLYGDPARDRAMAVRPGRPLLHAVQLEFNHPVTHLRMKFAAEPPGDILFAR